MTDKPEVEPLPSVVAPVTATVLAAAEDRHAGVASGVNNAVVRTAGLWIRNDILEASVPAGVCELPAPGAGRLA